MSSRIIVCCFNISLEDTQTFKEENESYILPLRDNQMDRYMYISHLIFLCLYAHIKNEVIEYIVL